MFVTLWQVQSLEEGDGWVSARYRVGFPKDHDRPFWLATGEPPDVDDWILSEGLWGLEGFSLYGEAGLCW